MTIGALLTPRHDGKRSWDTTMTAIKGPLYLPDDVPANYRKLWKDVESATVPASASIF